MNLNPITAIVGAVGSAWGAYQGRKAAAEAGARDLEAQKIKYRAETQAGARRVQLKKIDVEIARLEGKERRLRERGKADAEYDLQVLRNREGTRMDEFLILLFAAIFAAPFIGAIIHSVTCALGFCTDFGISAAVQNAWQAHGYDSAPWWFEFAMVGILVSTLGLMRVLRLFVNSLKMKFRGAKNAS